MTFRSKTEEQVAAFLDNCKVNYQYEPGTIDYTLQCRYKPDFVLINGVHLEVKGYFPSKDRRKMLAVKKDNPDLDIRMVFQKPYNTIYKGSKTTYAQWCERHGFPWTSFYDLPLEWIT